MISNYFSVSLVVCLLGITFFSIKIYMGNPHLCYVLTQLVNGETYKNVAELAIHYGNNHASSVWCLARIDNTKICHFRNLYYFPELRGNLLFILNEHSTISGIQSQTELKSINLSSVKNLTSVNMKLILIDSFENLNLSQKTIKVVDKKTLIMQRFKPDNIMHVIHDDLLPLYFTFHEICKGDIDHCLYSYHLTFIDNFEEGPFIEWYTMFSKQHPILLKNIKTALCIKESVVGLTKESVWFQYGYKNVHGPVLDTQFNGLKLKQFSNFLKRQLKIDSKSQSSSLEEETVVFLNRKINRRILNDKILEEKVQQIHVQLKNSAVKVVSLDLSTNDSRTIVHSLQNTKLLVGMHGSAMLLAIFLPQHSSIIELFPFGIQPYLVSPLKALCSLPNVSYRYNMWVNKDESNSVTHPELHPLLGGIRHLPLNKQVTIENTKLVPPVECCHNPVYLFRMFQDTIVDDSFFNLFRKVVNHGIVTREAEATHDFTYTQFYFPPPVFNLTCECLGGFLNLSWKFPFMKTGVKFSVATSTGNLLETELLHLFIEVDRCKNLEEQVRALNQEVSVVSVWVKTFEDGRESLDSYSECLSDIS